MSIMSCKQTSSGVMPNLGATNSLTSRTSHFGSSPTGTTVPVLVLTNINSEFVMRRENIVSRTPRMKFNKQSNIYIMYSVYKQFYIMHSVYEQIIIINTYFVLILIIILRI